MALPLALDCVKDCKNIAFQMLTNSNLLQEKDGSMKLKTNENYPSTFNHANKKWQKTASDAQAQVYANSNQAAKVCFSAKKAVKNRLVAMCTAVYQCFIFLQ